MAIQEVIKYEAISELVEALNAGISAGEGAIDAAEAATISANLAATTANKAASDSKFMGEHDSDLEYSKNNSVVSENVLYIAIDDVPSTVPITDDSYWQKSIDISGVITSAETATSDAETAISNLAYLGSWNIGTNYKKNNYVVSDDVLYYAIEDNISFPPAGNPAKWMVVLRTDLIISDAQDAISSVEAVELAVTSAEGLRVTAEGTRVSNENTRINQENTRVSQENTRISQENTRISQELTRVSQENSRVLEESDRVSAEDDRVLAEIARESAESDRDDAEVIRLASEASRVIAEDAREAAEALRESNTDTAILNAESATDVALETADLVEEYQNDLALLDAEKIGYDEFDEVLQDSVEYLDAAVIQLNLEKIAAGDVLILPEVDDTVIPNPPSGFRYLFFDSSNGNALTSKDSTGTLTTY